MFTSAFLLAITLSTWTASFDVRVEPFFVKNLNLPTEGDPNFYMFVANGKPNLRTLKFLSIARFPEHISLIPMEWQRTDYETVEYQMVIDSLDYSKLKRPHLDIPLVGCVNATTWKGFNMFLVCTGAQGSPTFFANMAYSIRQYSEPVEYVDGSCRAVNSSGHLLIPSTTRWNLTADLKMRKDCKALVTVPTITTVPTTIVPTNDSTTTLLDSASSSDGGLSSEVIVGIVIGCLVLILIIIIAIGMLCLRRLGREHPDIIKQQPVDYGSDKSNRNAIATDIESMADSQTCTSNQMTGTTMLSQQSSVEPVEPNLDDMMRNLHQKWEPLLSSLLVSRPTILLGEEIGRGAFGRVCVGSIQRNNCDAQKCAIKTIKVINNEKDVDEFLEEALILKDFQHENVVGIYAVCIPEGDSPLVCLEFMGHGDLRSYLRKARGSRADLLETPNVDVTTGQCVEFCAQIANGMDYLSGRGFVHRDLAARNCMLNDQLIVKIGDFGLARDIHEDHYYRIGTARCLPVKWMAIESITDQIFTTKSDVWSFGVVMWEIFSLGITPYPGVANHNMLTHLYVEKHRLSLPEGCPNELYPIMSSCWSLQPNDRPTFQQLRSLLDEFKDSFYVNVQVYNRSVAEYMNVNPNTKSANPATWQRSPTVVSTPYGSGASEKIEPRSPSKLSNDSNTNQTAL